MKSNTMMPLFILICQLLLQMPVIRECVDAYDDQESSPANFSSEGTESEKMNQYSFSDRITIGQKGIRNEVIRSLGDGRFAISDRKRLFFLVADEDGTRVSECQSHCDWMDTMENTVVIGACENSNDVADNVSLALNTISLYIERDAHIQQSRRVVVPMDDFGMISGIAIEEPAVFAVVCRAFQKPWATELTRIDLAANEPLVRSCGRIIGDNPMLVHMNANQFAIANALPGILIFDADAFQVHRQIVFDKPILDVAWNEAQQCFVGVTSRSVFSIDLDGRMKEYHEFPFPKAIALLPNGDTIVAGYDLRIVDRNMEKCLTSSLLEPQISFSRMAFDQKRMITVLGTVDGLIHLRKINKSSIERREKN